MGGLVPHGASNHLRGVMLTFLYIIADACDIMDLLTRFNLLCDRLVEVEDEGNQSEMIRLLIKIMEVDAELNVESACTTLVKELPPMLQSYEQLVNQRLDVIEKEILARKEALREPGCCEGVKKEADAWQSKMNGELSELSMIRKARRLMSTIRASSAPDPPRPE